MTKRLIVIQRALFALVLLSVMSSGYLRAPQLAAEEPLEIPAVGSSLPTDESVTWGQLDNGLIYAVMPNNEPKDKISMRLFVRAGSMQEQDSEQGMAHYLEHMGFNGSRSFPKPNQVIEELQKIGVAFGRDSNAHTGFDETVYKLDLPNVDTETIELGLKVFSDWSHYLFLNEKDVNAERGIILSEMRDRDGPQMRIWQGIYPRIFKGMIIGQRFPIGTKDSVESMDAAAMKTFYKKWYRMDRMVLVLVGQVQPDAAVALIKQAFAGIEKSTAPVQHPDYGQLEIPEGIQYYAQHEAESDSSFLYYSVSKPHVDKPDSIERRRLALHKALVCSIMDRRFQDYVEEHPDGPILGGGLSIYDNYGVDIAAISVQPKPDESLGATAVLEQELRRMRQFGPQATELTVAIASARAALAEAVSRKSIRTNRGLSRGLYSSVKERRVFETPEQEQAIEGKLLQAVTVADLQAAVDLAFNGGSQFMGLFGREDLGSDAAAQIQQAFEASAEQTLEMRAAAAALSWGYAQQPAPVAASQVNDLGMGISGLSYANNLRASLLPRSDKKNQILMQIRIHIDHQPQAVGVSEAFSAFMSGGLGKHDAKDLRQIFAGKRASVQVGVSQDEIVINGSCPPEELELLFQLSRAWITDPGWRDDGFKRFQTEWLEALASIDTNLDAMMGLRMQLLTTGGLSYLQSASRTEASAVTWDQVKNWAQPVFANGAIEMSLVGDFDLKTAQHLSDVYLGSLPQRQELRIIPDLSAEGALLPMSNLPTGAFTFHVDATVERAVIRILWPTDDAADVKQVRRLSQLAAVLSDKLRTKIREQLGDAYSPYATNVSSARFDHHGYFLLNVGIAPQRVSEVLPVLHQVVADLLANGIDKDLFQRVMTPTISSLPAYRNGNQYWLHSVVAQCQSNPQRLQWAQDMEADYQAITIKDLIDLAATYLRAKPLEIIAISNGLKAEPMSQTVKTFESAGPGSHNDPELIKTIKQEAQEAQKTEKSEKVQEAQKIEKAEKAETTQETQKTEK